MRKGAFWKPGGASLPGAIAKTSSKSYHPKKLDASRQQLTAEVPAPRKEEEQMCYRSNYWQAFSWKEKSMFSKRVNAKSQSNIDRAG